jgi:hypothetical protein
MKNIFIKLIIALIIIPFACNPKEENAPIDPCEGQKEVKADFVMEEYSDFTRTDNNWDYYDTDTSIMNSVRFTALDSTAQTYTWQIGTEKEPRFGRSFTIDFSASRTPKRIRLILQKKPNKLCFPFDDGIDTLERILYFVDRNDTNIMPMFGKFIGISTKNEALPITVQIGKYIKSGFQYYTYLGLIDCTAYTTNGTLGFRQHTPWGVTARPNLPNDELAPGCYLYNVISRLPDNTDSIYVQYKYHWSSDSTLYVFKGKKIK